MARRLSIFLSLVLMSSVSAGQLPARPPVIDGHTHILSEKGPGTMDSLNVR
jgi:hypothetical protein